MLNETTSKIVYQGNGVATRFSYPFKAADKAHIKVLLVKPDYTEQLLNKDYFVDWVGQAVHYPGYAPGGEPPLAQQPPKLPTGWKLVIYRETEITQLSDLPAIHPFDVIEEGLDKGAMIAQELKTLLDQAMKIPKGSVGVNPQLPAPVPRHSFRWNSDGTGLETTLDPETTLASVTALKNQAEGARDTAVSAKNTAVSAKDTAVAKASEAASSAAAARTWAEQAQNASSIPAHNTDVNAHSGMFVKTQGSSVISNGTLYFPAGNRDIVVVGTAQQALTYYVHASGEEFRFWSNALSANLLHVTEEVVRHMGKALAYKADHAPSGFGLGTVAKYTEGGDLDTLTLTGFYYANACANSPAGNGHVIVIAHSTKYATQYFSSLHNPSQHYVRTCVAGIWRTWQRIIEASMLSTVATSGKYSDLTSKPITVTQEWHDTNGNWYRKWSDGWIEQGGIATAGRAVVTNFHTPFSNTKYTLTLGVDNSPDDVVDIAARVVQNRTATSFAVSTRFTRPAGWTTGYCAEELINWHACGF